MSPLFLVNWHSVHVRFQGLMWMLVVVLTVIILLKVAPQSKSTAHATPRGVPLLAPSGQGKP